MNTPEKNEKAFKAMLDDFLDHWEERGMKGDKHEQFRVLIGFGERFYKFGREAVFSEKREASGVKMGRPKKT